MHMDGKHVADFQTCERNFCPSNLEVHETALKMVTGGCID